MAALEETSLEGTQGSYEFPYTSANPVPAEQPGWLWHQWPEPAISLVQYTAAGQTIDNAAVVWPPFAQTEGTAYVEVPR